MKKSLSVTFLFGFLALQLATPAVKADEPTTKQVIYKPDTSFATMRVLLFPMTKGEPRKYRPANERSLNICGKSNSAKFSFQAVGVGEELTLIDNNTGEPIHGGYSIELDFCEKIAAILSSQAAKTARYGFDQVSNVDLFVVAPKSINTRVKSPSFVNPVTFPGSFRIQAIIDARKKVVRAELTNYAELEDYVKGVLPHEMGEEFRDEARKTQAVAIRSYAVADMLRARCHPGYTSERCVPQNYDIRPTTQDQVYGGVMKVTERTHQAVEETKGEIVIKGNDAVKVVTTEYSPKGQGARMSQYAAGALAKRNKSYQEILRNQYPGTKVQKLAAIFPEEINPNAENGYCKEPAKFDKVILRLQKI